MVIWEAAPKAIPSLIPALATSTVTRQLLDLARKSTLATHPMESAPPNLMLIP